MHPKFSSPSADNKFVSANDFAPAAPQSRASSDAGSVSGQSTSKTSRSRAASFTSASSRLSRGTKADKEATADGLDPDFLRDFGHLAGHIATGTPQAGVTLPAGYVAKDPAANKAMSVAESLPSEEKQAIANASQGARDYLEATAVLRQKSKWARKAMPMIMQSAGMGLALAGAIHNPLLLFLAPALAISGAILAAPAGWLVSKFLQRRMLADPEVQAKMQVLAKLRAAGEFAAARAEAEQLLPVWVQVQGQGFVAQDPTLNGKKLAAAESFARGDKLFEAGFKRAFVGPFKFWRRNFNETMAEVGSKLENSRLDPAAHGKANVAP